ncbi:unnamed protein product [Rotaria sp. Silwood1]|nr:unnamed protein product [Rotaria sp. Silwood1]CAF1619112.1 unnamed protein product [Rotaria sp. Silwood1]
MCIGSTGRCWPDLLRELSKVQIADGLHERCFFCFDVNGDTDITQLTLVAEKQFYENLCDDLLSSTSINNLFGTALERHKAFPQNGVPIQPLEVGIQAATSAVALVFSFLLPQAVLLFNYESFNENKLTGEVAIDDRNLKMTKQEMTVLRIEKFIMKLKLARSGNNDSQNTQSTYDFKDINQRLSMIPVDNSIHNRTTVDRNSESTKGIEVDLGNPYEQNLSLATNIDVNVNEYFGSLKIIKLVSTSLCPSNLLVMTLQEAPYDRLNIDLSTLRKDICKEKTSYQDELLSNDEGLVNDNGRKQFKPNGEYK